MSAARFTMAAMAPMVVSADDDGSPLLYLRGPDGSALRVTVPGPPDGGPASMVLLAERLEQAARDARHMIADWHGEITDAPDPDEIAAYYFTKDDPR